MTLFIDKIIRAKQRLADKIERVYLKKYYGESITLNNAQLGRYFELDIKSENFEIRLGKNVYFRGHSSVTIRNKGKINVGNNVFFNKYISINCHAAVSIGNDCLFGENVKIYDHNHKFRDKTKPIADQGYTYGVISIGNNCWIASNVVILKGVNIGDNVVIGANCVVATNIPADTIVKSNNDLQYSSY